LVGSTRACGAPGDFSSATTSASSRRIHGPVGSLGTASAGSSTARAAATPCRASAAPLSCHCRYPCLLQINPRERHARA
jgi:hypothetical protein